MATFQLVARRGHPDFLDLPWDEPLATWGSDRLVDVAQGISRHVVRFVTYDGAVYAVKEISQTLADREYRLLRALAEADLPVVEAVDILGYRAHLERESGAVVPEPVAAYRWLTEVYEPITAAIPGDQRSKLELAETFHEVLEHRWFLSEAAGADVGTEAALRSYLESVLRYVPDEARLLPTPFEIAEEGMADDPGLGSPEADGA